ncbi:hypothetical protein J2T17_004389 [Paenibacillus mucilaginosus]|uniref:hypothetical protein n=1 Tax=Paenibacillus mucilaginosus TaxID=61624 RepID=UPI003D218960
MNAYDELSEYTILTPDERERREFLRQKICTVFQEDTFFRLLEDKGWTDRIFEGDILSFREDETYSTQKAAELLGLKDQQDIRNTFRSLKHYIRPDDSTGQNRFDYKAIIRLRMIFLLKSEYSMPSMEKLLSTIGKSTSNPGGTDALLLKLDEQDRKIELMGHLMKQLMENLSVQNKMLELRSSNEDTLKKKLEEQNHILMELQQKLESLEKGSSRHIEILETNREEIRQLTESKNDSTAEDSFVNKWMTMSRYRREAIAEWEKKPKTERFTKGFFGKEDINKRDIFIEDYIERKQREEGGV